MNGTISEFADIADYAFRIWTQVEVSKKSGQILGQPKFDVSIYKYVGSVSAKSVEIKDYSIHVYFIGNQDDRFVTPFIQRALKRAKTATKYMQLEMYSDITSSPKPLRKKILGGFPTIVLDDKAYGIKTKIHEQTSKIIPYIDDNGVPFQLNSEDDVLLFLSKKTGLKPEILGFETAFQPVDREIQKISERIKESARVGEERFLETLGLDELFEKIDSSLKNLGEGKITEDLQSKLASLKEEFTEKKKLYGDLKTQYEVVQENLENVKKEFEKKTITFDMYDTSQVKSITHRKDLERKLIDVQADLKSGLASKITEILEGIKEKSKTEKKK